jgi:hypothetical protein
VDDLMYDVLVPLQRIMDQGSLGGTIVGCLLAALFAPLLVLVHELGHAVAVRARGRPAPPRADVARVNGFHPRVDFPASPRPRASSVQVRQASGQAFKPQAWKLQFRRTRTA